MGYHILNQKVLISPKLQLNEQNHHHNIYHQGKEKLLISPKLQLNEQNHHHNIYHQGKEKVLISPKLQLNEQNHHHNIYHQGRRGAPVKTSMTYPPVENGAGKQNTRADDPKAIAEAEANLTVSLHIEIIIVLFAQHGHCRALDLLAPCLWVVVTHTGSKQVSTGQT